MAALMGQDGRSFLLGQPEGQEDARAKKAQDKRRGNPVGREDVAFLAHAAGYLTPDLEIRKDAVQQHDRDTGHP